MQFDPVFVTLVNHVHCISPSTKDLKQMAVVKSLDVCGEKDWHLFTKICIYISESFPDFKTPFVYILHNLCAVYRFII